MAPSAQLHVSHIVCVDSKRNILRSTSNVYWNDIFYIKLRISSLLCAVQSHEAMVAGQFWLMVFVVLSYIWKTCVCFNVLVVLIGILAPTQYACSKFSFSAISSKPCWQAKAAFPAWPQAFTQHCQHFNHHKASEVWKVFQLSPCWVQYVHQFASLQ